MHREKNTNKFINEKIVVNEKNTRAHIRIKKKKKLNDK